jgi:hypothetical protein
MTVEVKDEPLEDGQEQVKVAKKKKVSKKAAPKKLEKVNILKDVDYELFTVEAHQKTTDSHTHTLIIKKDDKIWKYGLSDKPSDIEILAYWKDLDKRK